MKEFAATDPDKFIAAAGALAHYVGDSSQPLHGSVMADGIEDEKPDIPRDSPSRKDKDGNKLPAFRGEGIHSVYETQMINMAAKKGLLFPEIRKNLDTTHGMQLVPDGRSAAVATLACMHGCAKALPPRTIIDSFETSFEPGSAPHTTALWNDLKTGTGEVMALGVRTLAMLWDAAWAAGGGHGNPGRQDPDVLRGHYEDMSFVRSVTVDEIEQEIAHPTAAGTMPAAGGAPMAAKKKAAKKKATKKKAAKKKR